MDMKTFSEQLNRLVACYGANAFNAERIRRIQGYVENLPSFGLQDIVDDIIDTMKFAPTPVDFKERVSIWRQANFEKTLTQEPHVVKCTDCYDTGFLFCKYKPDAQTTLSFCHCDFGAESEELERLKFPYLPRWEKGKFENVFGLSIERFPADKFKPNIERTDKEFKDSLWTLVGHWTNKKMQANSYWQKLSNEAREKQNAN